MRYIKAIIFLFLFFSLLKSYWFDKTIDIKSDFTNLFKYNDNIQEKIKKWEIKITTNKWSIECLHNKCILNTQWLYKEYWFIDFFYNNKHITRINISIDKIQILFNQIYKKNWVFDYSLINKEVVSDISIKVENWKKVCLNNKCILERRQWWTVFTMYYKWENIYENIYYPEFLDISDKLEYKRLQKYSLSCEISTTADILSYLDWKKIEEDEIINSNKNDWEFYNKSFKIENWKKVWWNPNEWFIWSIHNAYQYDLTWYGIYEKPIQKIYSQYWFENYAVTKDDYNINFNLNNHITLLLKELHKGYMVHLWWDYCTNPEYEDGVKNKCLNLEKNRELVWYYKNSQWEYIEHKWLSWEHSFYLLWYVWNIDNPSNIIVWDTNTGKHIYNIAEWKRKWNLMDNKSIVIKPHNSNLTLK